MGSSSQKASTMAMPASQEAIQRVILPAFKRTFGAYVKNRAVIQKLISASFVVYALRSTYSNLSGNSRKKTKKEDHLARNPRKPKIQIDAIFYARLMRLLRIVIPGWKSPEALMLALHSGFLVMRTMLSLYVADLDGRIVSSLVRSNTSLFTLNILKWLAISVPACYCNAMLDFLQSKLALAYRTRLTKKALGTYLEDGDESKAGQVFYKLANLDDRIKNADQMITVDIQRFSNHLAEIYSNIAKPVLDCLLYNYQLQKNVGAEGLVVLTVLVQATAGLLRAVTPPFGTYAAHEATLEGELRYTHSRLIENAEEIGFYRGHEYEKNVVERGYYGLVKHINRVLKVRIWHGVVEEGIVKWLWGSFGLCLCAIPVFVKIPGITTVTDLGSRTEGFVTNRRLLISSSDAFGRIMYSYKELAELAGYTARVSDLLDTMDEVEAGKFQKQLVSSAGTEENAKVLAGRGTIVESEDIKFDRVPIVSPNGDVLVKALSFEVKQGENLVVQGPNGCGKSSLFRILGGLWPVYGGTVHKPSSREFAYIPQRPYLTTGTFRDQIIYPQSEKEFRATGKTDHDLHAILEKLHMLHLMEKEGGLDARKEWRDALSGGDKQKIAMARLFYHRPKYAILDESSSAVPVETEQVMYEQAMALGITLLTVSHRPSLLQYHQRILEFDGQGGYIFAKLDPTRRLALQEEKQDLERKLQEVPKLVARLEELQAVKRQRRRAAASATA
ncbi:hypothetical protein NliqN6_3903 [Naganishia liquefaciens]|uniref:ABC transporter domain-containing protein n=1 Tax=Naganishia liquefaciens TaxID=104408 RepID=A0A8H3TV43_9TREE|nr:hypothetical protein NliqN6_3903 [Naganishia liquefaciens]